MILIINKLDIIYLLLHREYINNSIFNQWFIVTFAFLLEYSEMIMHHLIPTIYTSICFVSISLNSVQFNNFNNYCFFIIFQLNQTYFGLK